jgi:hypothetical protein
MIVSGGYTSVDVASDEEFSDAKTITHLLKEGTYVKPGTDTVELADGKKYSEVKRCELGIRSTDVDHNIDSVFALVKAAEELSSNLHFRFKGVDNTKLIVKNVLPTIMREMNQHGKYCATKILGQAVSDTEDNLIEVSQEPSIGIVDYYSELNCNTHMITYGADGFFGQSFMGDGSYLKSCQFYLSKRGIPPGGCHALLYVHSGIFGVSSLPVGDPLATSNWVATSSLPTLPAFALISFNFPIPYKLESNTPYVIMFGYYAGNSGNYPCVGVDDIAPTHPGNAMRKSTPRPNIDTIFYVYGEK